jgi:hypothetical protein
VTVADDDLVAPPGSAPGSPGPRVPAAGGGPGPAAGPAPVPGPGPAPVPAPGPGAEPGSDRATGPGFAAETYYAPGWQPPRPRTEPLAVASVPAGAVLGPVGIGLGAAALSRVRAQGTRGRGLAVVGMALGAAATLGWVVGGVAWWQLEEARAPLAGDVAAPATVHARQLVLGSCLDELPAGGEVARVRVVPCADEHRAQVVARTDFGPDETWPGAEAATARVARVCGPEALGPDAPADVARVVWAPSEASWGDGDRTGLCVAASDEPLPADLVG